MSDPVDEEIKEAIRTRPGDWKISLRGRMWTKQEILDNYDRNSELRADLRKLLYGLKLHELTRRPP